MDKETSAYLDTFRFAAALAVVNCHINDTMIPGALPFLQHFGFEGVGILFILSGFVIAYITDTKEKTFKAYTISRAARLYSVIFPCLFITFLLDNLGRHFHPHYYQILGSRTHELLNMLFSLTFLNYDFYLPHPIVPGSDGPYWSLCFEVPYYFVFAAAFFMRGFWRWLVPVVMLLCVGPLLTVMFPCWLGGVGIYHLCRGRRTDRRLGLAILIAVALLWLAIEVVLYRIGASSGIKGDNRYSPLLVYAGALPFALSIAGFRLSGIRIHRITAPVRWLAGATFTLYLLHDPLGSFISGMLPHGLPRSARWLVLILTCLGASLILAHFTERRKHVWKIAIEKLVARFETRKVIVS